jgi:Mn-dependent DtxR family transcriptional regulator
MSLNESAENYLETILILSKRGDVRGADIAAELGFSRPSVSVALKNLRNDGYVSVRENVVLLTDKGNAVAEATYARHTLLRDWLISLGVNAETAGMDACRIEHVISEESVTALRAHLSAGQCRQVTQL